MQREIVWLLPKKQSMENSASELALETLAGTGFKIVKIKRPFLSAFLKAAAVRRTGGLVYYQFGSPFENLICAALVAARMPVAAHYLDQISEGYPKWAKKLQLHWPITYILKNARVVFAISPAMKQSLIEEFDRHRTTLVRFRSSSDSQAIEGNQRPEFADTVIFAGNINPKTNLTGLLEAKKKLAQKDLKLAVFTRTVIPSILARLKEGGIEILAPLPAEKIVEESYRYAAQLVAFNFDAGSAAFYKTSTPSKTPNLLMARRRIIYFGPKGYWFGEWLLQYPDLAIELDRLDTGAELPKLCISSQRANDILADFDALSDQISWNEL